jgi:carbon-monoxide dehydrogenase medium subunit/2-furoyl-CoA dehydrogenase FAD binding subunit
VKPAAFDYVAPRSLEEAVAALADGGDEAKPIAGGQSLVPALNMRLVRPSLLVDLRRAGLDEVRAENGSLHVGATVTQAVLERDGRCPRLAAEALPHVGHFVTRNRGTVGGSIAHADGSAELPLCLVALDGTVRTNGRDIPAREFFVTHYLTTLEPGELVTETVWPGGAPQVAFEELALRTGDYALSMVAVNGTTVAVGAVTDRPLVLEEVGALLDGREVTAELAAEAGALAASLVDPAGHVHASPAYLKHLTGVLVERALRRAWTSS